MSLVSNQQSFSILQDLANYSRGEMLLYITRFLQEEDTLQLSAISKLMNRILKCKCKEIVAALKEVAFQYSGLIGKDNFFNNAREIVRIPTLEIESTVQKHSCPPYETFVFLKGLFHPEDMTEAVMRGKDKLGHHFIACRFNVRNDDGTIEVTKIEGFFQIEPNKGNDWRCWSGQPKSEEKNYWGPHRTHIFWYYKRFKNGGLELDAITINKFHRLLKHEPIGRTVSKDYIFQENDNRLTLDGRPQIELV